MMRPEVTFSVPIWAVDQISYEVLEWSEDGMTPIRTTKIGVFRIDVNGKLRYFVVREQPVAGSYEMTVSYFGELDDIIDIATAVEECELHPHVFHESYWDLWPELRQKTKQA